MKRLSVDSQCLGQRFEPSALRKGLYSYRYANLLGGICVSINNWHRLCTVRDGGTDVVHACAQRV
jgi:hypothetical protein